MLKNKLKQKYTAKIVFVYLILLTGAFISLFPFYWTLVGSFLPPAEIFRYPPKIIASPFTLGNYSNLVRLTPIYRNFLNSFFVASIQTILGVFFCSLGGYAFAKYKFFGNKILFTILLATMMIPVQVGLIPSFILMSWLHWADTYQAVIIPGLVSAFGIFFMRQNMYSIPNEIIEAARIDGCGEFKIYSHIIVPIARPAITALAILMYLGSWNNYLWPMIILQDINKYTLPVVINSLQGLIFRTPWGAILAGNIVTIIPMIIVFIILQKHFVPDISGGALKG